MCLGARRSSSILAPGNPNNARFACTGKHYFSVYKLTQSVEPSVVLSNLERFPCKIGGGATVDGLHLSRKRMFLLFIYHYLKLKSSYRARSVFS